jgi:hypothetical protein
VARKNLELERGLGHEHFQAAEHAALSVQGRGAESLLPKSGAAKKNLGGSKLPREVQRSGY